MKGKYIGIFMSGIISSSLITGCIVSNIDNNRYEELASSVSSLSSEVKQLNETSTLGGGLTNVATSNEGFQSALEIESAERKTSDSKISQSIGTEIETLKGYIGTASINNIADGTIKGAIGNTSIAGIGSENNITSAISSLNSDIIINKKDITTNKRNIASLSKNIISRIAYYTVVNGCTLSSINSTQTRYDNRKLSDYDLISVRVGTSASDIRQEITVPSNYVGTLTFNIPHGGSADSINSYSISSCIVTFQSDGVIKAKGGGSIAINKIYIIGYKLSL